MTPIPKRISIFFCFVLFSYLFSFSMTFSTTIWYYCSTHAQLTVSTRASPSFQYIFYVFPFERVEEPVNGFHSRRISQLTHSSGSLMAGDGQKRNNDKALRIPGSWIHEFNLWRLRYCWETLCSFLIFLGELSTVGGPSFPICSTMRSHADVAAIKEEEGGREKERERERERESEKSPFFSKPEMQIAQSSYKLRHSLIIKHFH